MTLKEIDKQIAELKVLRRQIEDEARERFKEKAKQHIGRCFKVNGKYAKIIDIPHEYHTMTGIEFNKYQFPAIYLGIDPDAYRAGYDRTPVVPFYEDTLFSGAWGEGNDSLNTYEEITPEEFEREFAEVLDKFRYQIGV